MMPSSVSGRLPICIPVVVGVLLAACSGSAFPASPSVTAEMSSSVPELSVPFDCPVTIPNGNTPPGESYSQSHHGNDVIWTALWPNGEVIMRPGGSGSISSDGTLEMKWPWWRSVPGELQIEGKRLDGSRVGFVRAHIPAGYGSTGFQASGLYFSGEGCWEVTAHVGDQSLSFVTKVVVRPFMSPEGELPAALLVRWRDWSVDLGGWRAIVSPLTGPGAEIGDRSPLDIGYAPQHGVSPDGRLMAVTARGSDRVATYDLTSWRQLAAIEAAPGLRLDTWSSDGSWTSDGSKLFAWREYCAAPAAEGRCLVPWERDLWQVDVRAQTASRVVAFDFSVQRMHVVPPTADFGGRAYAFAIRADNGAGINPQGDPFIAVIDLGKGEVIKEIELPGLLTGQPHHWLGDPGVYALYQPATALASDGSRLYVVDSVDFKVTVVDLVALRVEKTVDLREPRSRLARLGRWLVSQLVGTAEAKGGPSYSRRAQVTPDGRYLLISGMVSLKEPGTADRNPRPKDRPAGLVVVGTKKMTVVFREETAAWFKLSPDGRWLLTYGSYWDESRADANGGGGLVAFGLKLIDLDSLRVVRDFWPTENMDVSAMSADSSHAFIFRDGPGMVELRRNGGNAGPCRDDCWRLGVIDLQTAEVIADRPLTQGLGVISLAPR